MIKKIFKTRNLVIFAVAAVAIGGALIFQNCGSSSGTQNSQNAIATTSASTSCVLPGTVVWTVGANTCTAAGNTTIADGSSLTVVGASPSVGSATFSCSSGSLSGAFGSVCTTGCTTSACLANGVCGADNGLGLSSKPTGAMNLCAAGTASAISGSGPWTWTCSGNNGGSSVSCAASVGTTSGGGTTSNASLVPPCTVPGYNYPLGSGFLMNTQNGYGNVCCVIGLGTNGITNGIGWYCVDSPTWETASASGPATPLPAGTGCSLNLVAGYPVGAGVIQYNKSGSEFCCSVAHPYSGGGDGKTWYCEPSRATTAVTSSGATQAGTACSVQGITTYGNNTGITVYTSANQRLCCEIGAGYGGPGDGKGWYCEAY
jgi:hypothetical protein